MPAVPTLNLNPSLRPAPLTGRGGFTAIEISAVATIIAIMALILIPVVRNRVEEARRVAAQDDMSGIEKAQSLAYGYSNFYFRLMDLPRTESSQDPAANPAVEYTKLPKGDWRAPFTSGQMGGIATNWKGAFVAYHNTKPLNQLVPLYPNVFRSSTLDPPPGLGQARGPVLLFGQDDFDRSGSGALAGGRVTYPIDPWGNPYLFFGPGKLGTDGNPVFDLSTQQDWGNSAVYSMGPDGEPGSNANSFNNAQAYYREFGLLGAQNSDDLKREF